MASVPITALLNNDPLLCGCDVPVKGLSCRTGVDADKYATEHQ